MQATLHFDLACPEDRVDFEAAVLAQDYRKVLAELDNALRHWDKYGHHWTSPEEAIDGARKLLYELAEEYRLDLDG